MKKISLAIVFFVFSSVVFAGSASSLQAQGVAQTPPAPFSVVVRVVESIPCVALVGVVCPEVPIAGAKVQPYPLYVSSDRPTPMEFPDLGTYVTDKNGNAYLDLRPGSYGATVTASGYESAKTEFITAKPGETHSVLVRMSREYPRPPVGRTLVVVSPNGGEVWRAGETREIRWSITQWEEYLRESGKPLQQVQGKPSVAYPGYMAQIFLFTSDGSYQKHLGNAKLFAQTWSWTIPSDIPEGKNYRVRIEPIGAALMEQSTSTKKRTITPSIIEDVKSFFLGRSTESGVVEDEMPAILPMPPFEMRGDESDADFTITGGIPVPGVNISVVYPNGGETWKRGATYTIRWENAPMIMLQQPFDSAQGKQQGGAADEGLSLAYRCRNDLVTISLVRGGNEVKRIGTAQFTDYSYSWTVPNDVPDGSNYRVRIEVVSSCATPASSLKEKSGIKQLLRGFIGGAESEIVIYPLPQKLVDESDAPFTITGDQQPPERDKIIARLLREAIEILNKIVGLLESK